MRAAYYRGEGTEPTRIGYTCPELTADLVMHARSDMSKDRANGEEEVLYVMTDLRCLLMETLSCHLDQAFFIIFCTFSQLVHFFALSSHPFPSLPPSLPLSLFPPSLPPSLRCLKGRTKTDTKVL